MSLVRLHRLFSSLFVKTFLMFWITTLTMIFITFQVTRPLQEDLKSQVASEEQVQHLEQIIWRLNRLKNRPMFELERWIRIPRGNRGTPDMLFWKINDNSVLSNRPIPPLLDETRLSQFVNAPEPLMISIIGIQFIGPKRVTVKGDEYAVFAIRKMEPRSRFKHFADNPLWMRLGIPFLVSLIICTAFAWTLTKPIGNIRRTTHRIGQGDLSARIEAGLSRGDEIGELNRDFNRMAADLERLITAQKRLLADISHELRSPLARMQVAIGLARKLENDELSRHFDRIELESARLDQMIADSLNLSRLENDLQKSQLQPTSLNALLKEICDDARFEASEQNKQVVFADDKAVLILADAQLLASAIENVLRNAIKYTAEGTSVEVQLQVMEKTVGLTVRDHGPGVPENVLDKLFTPFYRVSSSRQRQTGGTGLGLAIAEKAIHQHRGRISASNAPDGGLIMHIRLPIASAAERRQQND